MKPILVRLGDERAQIATVAERWKSQYYAEGKWGRTIHGPAEDIYVGLAALAPDATAQDVKAIIGNSSWIGYACNGCDAQPSVAWQIGDEPDYESHTVVLCPECMDRLFADYQS